MDNASVHYYEEVADIITGVGSTVHFLPPYLPELKPIENAFSEVKASCGQMTVYLSTYSHSILMAFCTITKDDCINCDCIWETRHMGSA